MALTNGQMMTLFVLISTRSEFRFQLERRTPGPLGTANPFPDRATFAPNLQAAIKALKIGISAADLAAMDQNSDIAGLWVGPRHNAGVPDRQIASITTDHNEIITAVGLDAFYTPDNPCPSGQNQLDVASAVAALHL